MPSRTPGLSHTIISSACFPVPGLGKPSVSGATRSHVHTFTRTRLLASEGAVKASNARGTQVTAGRCASAPVTTEGTGD